MLKQWIAAGAAYQLHWSFIAPDASRAAQGQESSRGSAIRSIAFVLAKLEENGLEPAPEADRRTLARRLSST